MPLTASWARREAHRPAEARAWLDEAIDLLARRGVDFADREARDLLASADALQTRTDPPTLRARSIRSILAGLPRAFTLFDREGRKVGTLAGGFGHRRQPLCAPAVSELAPQGSGAPAALLESTIAELDQLPGLDLLGQAPAANDAAPEIAEAYRLYAGLRCSTKPQIARIKDPESLDCIRHLLQVVRRTRPAAEQKPLLILEAVAEEPLVWPRTACRVLIDAARAGIPAAIVVPFSRDDQTAEGIAGEGLIASIATGLAAIAVHQFARRAAPLLWGIPLRDLGSLGEEARDRWRRLSGVAAALELPMLATRTQGHPAGAPAALQAAVAGADLIAFAGLDAEGRFSMAGARDDHRQIAELRAARALLAGAGRLSTPLPRAAGQPVRGPARPPLDPDLATGLAAVIRRQAERCGAPLPPGVAI